MNKDKIWGAILLVAGVGVGIGSYFWNKCGTEECVVNWYLIIPITLVAVIGLWIIIRKEEEEDNNEEDGKVQK